MHFPQGICREIFSSSFNGVRSLPKSEMVDNSRCRLTNPASDVGHLICETSKNKSSPTKGPCTFQCVLA